MHTQDIALNKLFPSTKNVRKIATAGIEALAESITAHGLLHNLVVEEVGKNRYEVIAGGRRLAALKKLAERKEIKASHPVPCAIIPAEANVSEISLAENVSREPMHPADELEAWRALVDGGSSIEDIAARFGVTPGVVTRRLKLARVSPVLLDLFRKDEIDLEQLRALAISDDHATQERIWNATPPHMRHAGYLKNALTASHVAASDRRAVFVGIDAYIEAGGEILNDLFSTRDGRYLKDSALLDRLALEKLEGFAEPLRADGWKWVQCVPVFGYEERHAFGRLNPVKVDLTEEEDAQLSALAEEHDELVAEYEADESDELRERIEAISQQIDALNAKQWRITDEGKAASGVVLAIDHQGELEIHGGLVRPEDRKTAAEAAGVNASTMGGKQEKEKKPVSDKLVEEMSAHRTAALRAEVMNRPDVALVAIVHNLALCVFNWPGYDNAKSPSMVSFSGYSYSLHSKAEGIEETPAWQAVEEAHAAWTERLPSASADLWSWLAEQDQAVLLDLLAFCTANTIYAVEGQGAGSDRRQAEATATLAREVNLDMAKWWSATEQTYLGRVSKPLVIEAVKEANPSFDVKPLESMKKAALAEAAAKVLDGTGWLPAYLRTEAEAGQVQQQEAAE